MTKANPRGTGGGAGASGNPGHTAMSIVTGGTTMKSASYKLFLRA